MANSGISKELDGLASGNPTEQTGPASYDADLIVIGGGPGGYTAAIRAAQLGQSVILVEKEAIGGVCLNWGCIPSKALIQAGKQYEKMCQASQVGIVTADIQIDMKQMQAWKNGIVDRLTQGVKQLLSANGVTVLSGEACFQSPHSLEITESNGQKLTRTAKHSIIATGSSPIALPHLPLDHQVVLGSREVLSLQHVPQSLAIVGAGVIGLEIATLYAKLGTQVTLIEQQDRLLPALDDDITRLLKKALKHQGIALHLSSSVQGCTVVSPDAGAQLTVADTAKNTGSAKGRNKSATTTINAEKVLVCVGRKPNTEALNLSAANLSSNAAGFIETNHWLQTATASIYAIGDVTGGPLLAHKASREGLIAAEQAAGKARTAKTCVMPAVIFSDPEIAFVGLSEKAAKAYGYAVKVGKFPFAANGRALTLPMSKDTAGKEHTGMVKLITDAKSNAILGAQCIGADVSEIISEITLAIEMSATADDLALTVHAHPTLSESWMEAAEAVENNAIHIFHAKK
ncbi:MAG: dihydrolipoyl dehydrogenase [Cyanobacteria bacterium P01_H01_bin.74]